MYVETTEDIQTRINGMRAQVSTHQDGLTRLDALTTTNSNQCAQNQELLDRFMESNKELAKDLDAVKIRKMDESVFQTMKRAVLQNVQKSLARIEDVNSKVESTDNYIARYLPFNCFCQIIEACKIVNQSTKDPLVQERTDNYEKHKMKELYNMILFDDGRAPKDFNKCQLLVGREAIDEVINKDVRLMSRNLRTMQTGPLAQVKRSKEAMNIDL
jgi:hypothetical protein